MKQTALWILRCLLIPVGFIWATGIPKFISSIEEDSHQDPWRTFSTEEIATLQINPDNLRSFGDSLVRERTQHIKETGFYEPYLYFGDLKQYVMFELLFRDSLNKTFEGRGKALAINHGKDRLMALRDENWRHFENIQKIKGHSIAGQMNIEEAQHFWFPKIAEEDSKIVKVTFNDILGKLVGWFWWFYLRGFPFALMLFFIWKIRLKDEILELYWGIERKNPDIDTGFTPLSFLISVLLWPIILAIDIRNSIADSLVKAEVLSRRQSMMTLLSKQERKLIEAGKKMSLKELRSYLDSLGMRRRHSFVSALFVVFFLVSSQRSFPYDVQCQGLNTTTITVTFFIDTDVGWVCDLSNKLSHCVTLLCVGWSEKVVKAKSIFLLSRIKAIPGFARVIEGVPKVSNQFHF